MSINLSKHKETLINFFDMFALYEIAFVGALFIVFLLFFMLGILLRGRKFLPKIFFFLAFLVFASGPIAFKYFMDEFLYKLEIQVLEARKLEYIDSFLLRAKIKHDGFLASRICTASVDIPHDGALSLLGVIYPRYSYRHIFEMPLDVGEEDEIYAIFNDFEVKNWSRFEVQVRCRNSNAIASLGKRVDKNGKLDVFEAIVDSVEHALDIDLDFDGVAGAPNVQENAEDGEQDSENESDSELESGLDSEIKTDFGLDSAQDFETLDSVADSENGSESGLNSELDSEQVASAGQDFENLDSENVANKSAQNADSQNELPPNESPQTLDSQTREER